MESSDRVQKWDLKGAQNPAVRGNGNPTYHLRPRPPPPFENCNHIMVLGGTTRAKKSTALANKLWVNRPPKSYIDGEQQTSKYPHFGNVTLPPALGQECVACVAKLLCYPIPPRWPRIAPKARKIVGVSRGSRLF